MASKDSLAIDKSYLSLLAFNIIHSKLQELSDNYLYTNGVDRPDKKTKYKKISFPFQYSSFMKVFYCNYSCFDLLYSSR